MNSRVKKRFFAILLCICFVAVPLLATAVIVEHSNHYCIGHDCPACAQIHLAEKALEQISLIVSLITIAFISLFSVFSVFQSVIENIHLITPVTQKIRMNN